jgi:outer membrane lipoprotein-sorting protein
MRKVLLAAFLVVLPGLAAQQPSVQELVERFDAAQAKAQTLQTPFTLTIRRALMKTPTITKGTFYLQGSDFVHFTFAPPEDLIIHITPKELLSYSRTAGQGERLKIGFIKNANRKFLGLGQKLTYLSDFFALSFVDSKDLGGAWLLTLQPRSLSMRKRFRLIQLWVDKDSYLPRQVEWTERSGDSWLLELGLFQINQALPAAVIGFRIPDGIPVQSEFSFFATRKK